MFRRSPFNTAVALAVVLFMAACSCFTLVLASAMNLNGRWVSLQYGSLAFTQNGNAFTAVWTGTKAAGTISGRQASFRFWAGSSFENSKDDSRGYGTLTLSDDGNTLSGSWANMSKKDPESGGFTAMRVTSTSGQITQDAAPAPEEMTTAQTAGTKPAPPDAHPTAGADLQQTTTGSQTSEAGTPSAAEPPDELILLPENLPPEYAGPIMEVISDLEESVLMIFGVFDDGSGDESDTVPQPIVDMSLPEDSPLQDSGYFWDFFADLWTSIWGQ